MELVLEETMAGMKVVAVAFAGVAWTAISEKATGTPTLTLHPYSSLPLALYFLQLLPPPLPLPLNSTLKSMRTLKFVSISVVTVVGLHPRREPTSTG